MFKHCFMKTLMADSVRGNLHHLFQFQSTICINTKASLEVYVLSFSIHGQRLFWPKEPTHQRSSFLDQHLVGAD